MVDSTKTLTSLLRLFDTLDSEKKNEVDRFALILFIQEPTYRSIIESTGSDISGLIDALQDYNSLTVSRNHFVYEIGRCVSFPIAPFTIVQSAPTTVPMTTNSNVLPSKDQSKPNITLEDIQKPSPNVLDATDSKDNNSSRRRVKAFSEDAMAFLHGSSHNTDDKNYTSSQYIVGLPSLPPPPPFEPPSQMQVHNHSHGNNHVHLHYQSYDPPSILPAVQSKSSPTATTDHRVMQNHHGDVSMFDLPKSSEVTAVKAVLDEFKVANEILLKRINEKKLESSMGSRKGLDGIKHEKQIAESLADMRADSIAKSFATKKDVIVEKHTIVPHVGVDSNDLDLLAQAYKHAAAHDIPDYSQPVSTRREVVNDDKLFFHEPQEVSRKLPLVELFVPSTIPTPSYAIGNSCSDRKSLSPNQTSSVDNINDRHNYQTSYDNIKDAKFATTASPSKNFNVDVVALEMELRNLRDLIDAERRQASLVSEDQHCTILLLREAVKQLQSRASGECKLCNDRQSLVDALENQVFMLKADKIRDTAHLMAMERALRRAESAAAADKRFVESQLAEQRNQMEILKATLQGANTTNESNQQQVLDQIALTHRRLQSERENMRERESSLMALVTEQNNTITELRNSLLYAGDWRVNEAKRAADSRELGLAAMEAEMLVPLKFSKLYPLTLDNLRK